MKKKVMLLTAMSLCAGILSSAFLANCNNGKNKGDNHRYNIVLIVADALRFDIPGCYGGDARTPNIDRLAENGTLFENAYSTAPCTESAVVAIFTGNYSSCYKVINTKKRLKGSKRIYSYYVNDSAKLPAEILKEMDFDVRMEVENGIATRSNHLQGFETLRHFEQMSKEEVAFVEKTIGISTAEWEDGSKLHHVYNVLHYLLTAPDDKNFFLMKWFMDPHMPFTPVNKFKSGIVVDAAKLPEKIDFYSTKRDINFRGIQKRRKITGYEYYYLKELYKAEVTSVDERIGFILKALESRNLLDSTYVIFTSDHGELFGEKGRRGHGTYLDEPLIHVPFIIAGPGIPKGKRVKSRISHLALMPALMDLLQVKQPGKMQGKSFKPLLQEKASRDVPLFFDGNSTNLLANRSSYALIINDYKLIANRENEIDRYELYNLTDDQAEKNNIFEKYPDVMKRMLQDMADFRKKNEALRKYNLSKIDKKVDLSEEWEKTRQTLKALGYID